VNFCKKNSRRSLFQRALFLCRVVSNCPQANAKQQEQVFKELNSGQKRKYLSQKVFMVNRRGLEDLPKF